MLRYISVYLQNIISYTPLVTQSSTSTTTNNINSNTNNNNNNNINNNNNYYNKQSHDHCPKCPAPPPFSYFQVPD